MAGNLYAWSTTAATNASSDSTINFAEGQLPGTLNDSDRAAMPLHAPFLADNNGSLTTAGSASAQTVTSNLTKATLPTDFKLRFQPKFPNTPACPSTLTP